MKNLLFLTLGLFLIIPINENTKGQFETTGGVIDISKGREWADYFESSLELFTFDYYQEIVFPDGSTAEGYGKAFIAGGKIITAEHLTVFWNDYLRNDIVILGPSPIHGLDICHANHGVGDTFYYRTRHDGVKHFTVTFETGNNYEATMDRPMRHGESGSPIVCDAHKKVVALATAYGEAFPGQYYSIITKIPRQQYPF